MGTVTPFHLETSFKTLYSEDNHEQGPKTTQVVIMPTSTLRLTSNLPIPKRFPYQHIAPAIDSQTLARLFLQLVGQMTGMMSGSLPLILFDLDRTSPAAQGISSRDDTVRTFARLAPESRPQLTLVARPEAVGTHVPAGGSIAVTNPMDFLMHLPHTVDPDIHYDLLSKRTLALSGLPTPTSRVVDTSLLPSELAEEAVLAAETGRMLDSVRQHDIPFVVKLPQALSGTGTFIIRNETERQATLVVLGLEVKRMLAAISPENVHLTPASIILQEFVPGPAAGLSLFITKSGRWEFISCTRQMYDDTSGGEGWSGGYISYAVQSSLRDKYASTAQAVADYTHGRGYHGPVGIDVLSRADGTQLIIDMNIRLTGTMPLGFWKTHFLDRNLQEAAIFFPIFLDLTRDRFEEIFEKELGEGRIVEIAWSHDDKGLTSATILILAGRTLEELEQLNRLVKRYRIEK